MLKNSHELPGLDRDAKTPDPACFSLTNLK